MQLFQTDVKDLNVFIILMKNSLTIFIFADQQKIIRKPDLNPGLLVADP